MERARAEKDANELKESSKLQVELEKMQEIAGLLGDQNGALYLELLRSQNFAQVKQDWYIITNAPRSIYLCT